MPEIKLNFTKLEHFEVGNKKIPIDHKTDAFLFERGLRFDDRLSTLTDEQTEVIRCFGLLQTQMILTQGVVYLDALLADKKCANLEKEVFLSEREKRLNKENALKISPGHKLTLKQRLRGIV